VTPDHNDYAQIMGSQPSQGAVAPVQSSPPQNPQQGQSPQNSAAPSATGRPSWAQ